MGGSWSAGTPLPAPRSEVATAVLDGRIYVAGGFGEPGGQILDSFVAYDPATDAWTDLAPLPEPIEENVYHFSEEDLQRRNIGTLPTTLGEAIIELQRNETIRDALGEHVFERLLEAQKQEWSAFCRHVSSWERERYLEVY